MLTHQHLSNCRSENNSLISHARIFIICAREDRNVACIWFEGKTSKLAYVAAVGSKPGSLVFPDCSLIKESITKNEIVKYEEF